MSNVTYNSVYLTEEDVDEMVKVVEATMGDPEAAHSIEDRYTIDVLEDIAARDCTCGCPEIAAAMLASFDLDYDRWYA